MLTGVVVPPCDWEFVRIRPERRATEARPTAAGHPL